jgi:hypothetical protein
MNAGKTDNVFSISPQSVNALRSDSQKIPLAALVEKGDMRLVVVSSSTLAEDQFCKIVLIMWLFEQFNRLFSCDKDLAAIPQNQAVEPC